MQTYLKDLKWGKFNLIKGDMISDIAAYCGEWSDVEVSIFQKLLAPDANVIEVGANIGMHTVPLAKIAYQGKVIGFEPQRIIFQQLCCNLALNNLVNVETYRLGVSNQSGKCDIESSDYSKAWNYGSFSLHKGFSTEKEFHGKISLESIDVVKLDDFAPVQQLPYLSLLKIDAEGLDLNVLQGATQTIQRFQPAIFVEIQEDSAEILFNYLKSLDYVPFWVCTERYQEKNFYSAKQVDYGADANFLALPKNIVNDAKINKQSSLSSFVSLLQEVESVDDLAQGKVRLLVNL